MPAFAFDSTGIPPATGGGAQLPLGKAPFVIVDAAIATNRDNVTGAVVLTFECLDGPSKGARGDFRLNMHHHNETTVRIAQEQMSAICHVTGVYRFNDPLELTGYPMILEVGQGSEEKYTEVKKIRTIDDRVPGTPGNPPQRLAQYAKQSDVQGGGGQPGYQPQQGGGFQPAQQPAQQGGFAQPAQQPAQQAWGGGAAQQPAGDPNQQPQQQQPAQAAWGQGGATQPAQQQPQQQGGGAWQQQPAQGGAPATAAPWGAR